MSPDKWLDHHYLNEKFSGKFEHLPRIIKELKLTPVQAKIITIAGTNGKGQTARSLCYYLQQAGRKTGLLTSPHLVTVNERFVFDQQQIEDQELLSAFEDLQAKLSQRVSYFEFLFLVFLWLANKKQLDFLILEVGLGGRLDAVNAIDPDVCVITSISRDHQELLGDRYQQILVEKAGILRRGCPVFTAFQLDYLDRKFAPKVAEMRADWFPLPLKTDKFSTLNAKLAKHIAEQVLGERIKSECPDYARRFAIQRDGALFEGFPSHNLDGLRKLFQLLSATKYNYIVLSFSQRSDEECEQMLRIMLRDYSANQLIYLNRSHLKSLSTEKIKRLKDKFGFHTMDEINRDDLQGNILVTGSNYFLGHFIQYLQRC